MTFEEEFQNFEKNWNKFINWDENLRGYDKELLQKEMIEKCLDKERVRETIKDMIRYGDEQTERDGRELLKKLGLEW